MNLKQIILLLLSLTSISWSLDSLKNIAVMEFQYSEGISNKDALAISKRFEVELQQTEQFQVFERTELNEILNEQGFQQSGACDEDSCSVEVGRLIGVDHMVMGNVSLVGETYSLSVRMIDVESGSLVSSFAHDVTGDIDDVLTSSCTHLAREMAGLEPLSWWHNPWVWGTSSLVVIAVTATYLLTAEEPKTEVKLESVILN